MTHEHGLEYAYKMACRSSMKRFRVGATIVARNKRGIASTGWSHMSDFKLTEYMSIHAEVHAIHRCAPRDLRGSTIYIVTQIRKSENRVNGRPCRRCAVYLRDAGVARVVYSLSNNEYGVWNFDEVNLDEMDLLKTRKDADWES